jgi:exodeoxyribonuclease V beta subunit
MTLQPFDVCGTLPTGTTVLEASAGTGKTWTIAALVTRYVAQGVVPLEQLLVVTFGRAATSELRTRVRERFRDTRDALIDPDAARKSPDAIVALLADAPDAEVAARRQRLADALATFDAATVATTHEFCQQALRSLGTAADLDVGTELVDDLDDLVTEVRDDLFLRFQLRTPNDVFTRDAALAVARAAVADPTAVLLPTDAPADSLPQLRVRFATAVREQVERRARARRVMGFDHLLLRVRDALVDPVSGPVARQRLRDRYCVVLVDEFQDTDPVQWDVLREAFHGHATLVVIGDPKQAIYAFRGADVQAYLAALGAAGTQATLGTNYRSDGRLLSGLARLFRGAQLGAEAIAVRPVEPAYAGAAVTPAVDAAVRVRVVPRAGMQQWKGLATVGPARAAIAADVAAEVVALLGSGAEVTSREARAAPRPLRAGDVAVLVRTGKQAQLIHDALSEHGVPCVLPGTSSVFATSAATDWTVLLEALDQPHRTGRVRRLALTPLVGWSATELDAGGEAAVDALALRLRGWAEVLATRGVAALFSAVSEQQALAERLLQRPDGERLLTDLRHVAEALHGEALASQLGATGLLSWLRARSDEASRDQSQERSRRLDTDAAAVQILTVHGSKGLEFPVVLAPFAWDVFGGGKDEKRPRGHLHGRRVLHVGGETDPGYAEACRLLAVDEAGEELRLLYVAATRAVSRLVLWWAATNNTPKGPLHRLLFTDRPADGLPLEVAVPSDDDAVRRLARLVGDGLAVEVVDRGRVARELPPEAATPVGELHAARFARGLDVGWRRTSYSGLTRDVHEQPAVGSEAQAEVRDDEADEPPPLAASGDEALRAVPSPMAAVPSGAWFGTVVHAVLETADLQATDLLGALTDACAEQLRHRAVALDPAVLAEALLPAVSTPLGPFADGLSYAQVAPRDRLVELGFELPLAGGDTPAADVRLGAVAALLEAHLPSGDPVAPYAAMVRARGLGDQPLRGYLTGSLDAVLRVAGPRYVVVDHKTNRLADRDEALTAWHYRRDALDAAVLEAHYPLQALLYCVALHRFLRWRQAGYDPETHLGGVLYLFLRGMCGDAVAADGEVPGVWAWKPPAALVVALSDLLAGVAA